MNQLWNVGNLRDYWPRWTPAAVQNLSWLNAVDCFRPRMFIAPDESTMDVAASGYLIQTFSLIPGSWLIGFSEVNATALDFQVTDLANNYQFFSAPMSAALMAPNGAFTPPFWLPEAYEVVGPAVLRIEIWNNTATATDNSQIVFHVLEPKETQ